jgi:hypothetical protein
VAKPEAHWVLVVCEAKRKVGDAVAQSVHALLLALAEFVPFGNPPVVGLVVVAEVVVGIASSDLFRQWSWHDGERISRLCTQGMQQPRMNCRSNVNCLEQRNKALAQTCIAFISLSRASRCSRSVMCFFRRRSTYDNRNCCRLSRDSQASICSISVVASKIKPEGSTSIHLTFGVQGVLSRH